MATAKVNSVPAVPVLKQNKGKHAVVWKDERIKKAGIKGEEYKNYRGHTVPARRLGDFCK